MKMEGTTMAQSRNALVALCYIANVKREIVHDNLAILTSFGLGERWKVPFETPCFLFVSLSLSRSLLLTKYLHFRRTSGSHSTLVLRSKSWSTPVLQVQNQYHKEREREREREIARKSLIA